MEEQKAHELYQLFQKVNDNAKRGRGLGFGGSSSGPDFPSTHPTDGTSLLNTFVKSSSGPSTATPGFVKSNLALNSELEQSKRERLKERIRARLHEKKGDAGGESSSKRQRLESALNANDVDAGRTGIVGGGFAREGRQLAKKNKSDFVIESHVADEREKRSVRDIPDYAPYRMEGGANVSNSKSGSRDKTKEEDVGKHHRPDTSTKSQKSRESGRERDLSYKDKDEAGRSHCKDAKLASKYDHDSRQDSFKQSDRVDRHEDKSRDKYSHKYSDKYTDKPEDKYTNGNVSDRYPQRDEDWYRDRRDDGYADKYAGRESDSRYPDRKRDRHQERPAYRHDSRSTDRDRRDAGYSREDSRQESEFGYPYRDSHSRSEPYGGGREGHHRGTNERRHDEGRHYERRHDEGRYDQRGHVAVSARGSERPGGKSKVKGQAGGPDWSALIEGYDDMTPAEKVKARMRHQLQAAHHKTRAVDAVEAAEAAKEYSRFAYNEKALFDDQDEGFWSKYQSQKVVRHASAAEGADADEEILKAKQRRVEAVRKADASHEEAIFGRITAYAAASDEEEEEDTEGGRGAQQQAQGRTAAPRRRTPAADASDSDDPPVIVSEQEEEEEVADDETLAVLADAVKANQGLSWRERALQKQQGAGGWGL